MVMECLYRYTAASQAAIGQQMGGVDYSWVSRQRKVLREAMARERGAKEQFERLQKMLLTHKYSSFTNWSSQSGQRSEMLGGGCH
jgi:hypothetical protein